MTRTIKITPVLNGYIVRVGCSKVVFESREKLLMELDRYLCHPEEVEKEYEDNAINPRPTLELVERGASLSLSSSS